MKQPSPPENSEPTVVRDEGEVKKPALDDRIEQAEARTEQAEARTEQAKTRTEQAETRAEQAETRSEQVKTLTERAEMRTERAEMRTERAEIRTEQAEMQTAQAEKKSVKAISASELSYRRLFEGAKDGILMLDVETGRITDVNPFLVELLGFSHTEMVGKTVGELSPFKDIECNQAMLEQLQQSGYVRYDDLPLETRDGRRIAVEFVSNVYQAGDGKVIQCNIRDITERKQASLVAMRLASIVESSEDAIIGKDLNSIVTSWNKGAEKIFGYTAGEMVGTSIMRLIPANRKEEEENQILKKIACGISVEHFETIRQTKDGRLIDVSATVSPIRDATGAIIGLSKVARDISERKHLEEARRKSEERYRTLFEYAPDGIVIADPQSYYLDANTSMCRMLGYSRDELIGLHASDIVAEEEIEHIEPALSMLNAKSGHQREWRFRRKDGSVFDTEVTATVMPDGNLLAVIRDITARKAADASLRAAEQDRHMASEASRLKSEFLANMSHELRTPLNSVIGFTEFLVDEKPGPLNARQKEYLTDVHNSAQHLLQLINDVLDLAKVEAGKIELNPETFLLSKAIEEVCSVVKGIALKKQVEIKCVVASELDEVTLDQSKLKQICYNLLANAVKFTNSGGSVEISVHPNASERFEVRVQDTGIGIKQEDLQRLFRQFEQLEMGTARRFEGSGLGLALTKKLVEFQGGSIRVESEYGKGSTFTVVLPTVVREIKPDE